MLPLPGTKWIHGRLTLAHLFTRYWGYNGNKKFRVHKSLDPELNVAEVEELETPRRDGVFVFCESDQDAILITRQTPSEEDTEYWIGVLAADTEDKEPEHYKREATSKFGPIIVEPFFQTLNNDLKPSRALPQGRDAGASFWFVTPLRQKVIGKCSQCDHVRKIKDGLTCMCEMPEDLAHEMDNINLTHRELLGLSRGMFDNECIADIGSLFSGEEFRNNKATVNMGDFIRDLEAGEKRGRIDLGFTPIYMAHRYLRIICWRAYCEGLGK